MKYYTPIITVLFALSIFGSCNVDAQIRPGLVPNQTQAVAQASSFLTDLEEYRYESAYARLGSQARSLGSATNFSEHISQLMDKLGGAAYDRVPVGAQASNVIQGVQRPGQYFQIRFRAIYPVGAIFQDISLELEPEGIWRVVGWWFPPAGY